MSVMFVAGNNPLTALAGQIRFNSTTNKVETFDGNDWIEITATHPTISKFDIVDPTIDKLPAPPKGHHTVDANTEVMMWVTREMPVHMWKYDNIPAYSSARERIIVSDKLLMLMRLKFSS